MTKIVALLMLAGICLSGCATSPDQKEGLAKYAAQYPETAGKIFLGKCETPGGGAFKPIRYVQLDSETYYGAKSGTINVTHISSDEAIPGLMPIKLKPGVRKLFREVYGIGDASQICYSWSLRQIDGRQPTRYSEIPEDMFELAQPRLYRRLINAQRDAELKAKDERAAEERRLEQQAEWQRQVARDNEKMRQLQTNPQVGAQTACGQIREVRGEYAVFYFPRGPEMLHKSRLFLPGGYCQIN